MRPVRTVVSEDFFRRFKTIFAPHLATLGIDLPLLERADIEIPGEQYIALWEAAGSANPSVGLELGSQTEAGDFGALGHAMHCAPSVEQMLLTLHTYIVVFAQESRVDYSHAGRLLRITYQVTDNTVLSRRQDAEFAIAAILRQLQLITASPVRPLRVDFEHARPADVAVHKQLFQCPVHFNQPGNSLSLPAEVLELPVRQGNERLFKALAPYLEREREQRSVSDELLPQVTRMIALGMASGVPSLDEVSARMGLSRRTLQRRLKEQEIEFSVLVEEVRRDLAVGYLNHSDFSMTQISLLLGYAESGSFTRAFRRWTGQSPQQFRQAGRGPGTGC
ncbi:AraC-like transcriptional regulator QhpR [Pseudomonas xantholysinigenes]|jgi:AraC-like DNA-binding protein|uniref:AraC family transcriptional regulator n=1 Tax=Pseudomonas xantholysinigenes TaxID=2745490 RepID=A0A9E6PZ92_9PSED|nr:AraC family transcriptional regulator [Pseudomonas xantholysinigenes]QXI40305.1 AraC family transcriptional regulator [Pseudomonas xantholysinigenes]